jgi:excisionase family DNA binding protein
MNNFADFVTIKQASELLGVSPSTLRNWDRSGKVKAWRHPLNGYRLYRRRQLEALLASLLPIDAGEAGGAG